MSDRGDMALDAQKEREREDRQAAMTREDVVGKVVEILCDQFGCDNEEIDINDRLVEDLGADELDLVEIILAVEGEFDIDIEDEDSGNVVGYTSTVTDLVNHICKAKGITG